MTRWDDRPDPSDAPESVSETLAILADPVAIEQIRQNEQAIGAGELGASLADLRAQLEHRRRDAAR